MSFENCNKTKVLFVCFGNTCRSPMAEAIFSDLVRKRNLQEDFYIDSAALSDWQCGSGINVKVEIILERIGIKDFTHVARQISYKDFQNFDFILGMEYFHIEELTAAADALKSNAKVFLLGAFNPDKSELIIRDPICSSMSKFEKCYDQISASCNVFLEKILDKSV